MSDVADASVKTGPWRRIAPLASSIHVQLAGWFVAIALLPSLLVGAIADRVVSTMYADVALERLGRAAADRAAALERYAADRSRIAGHVAADIRSERGTPELMAETERVRDALGFAEVAVLGTDGSVVASASRPTTDSAPADAALVAACQRIAAGAESAAAHVPGGGPWWVAPLRDGGAIVGYVALESTPEEILAILDDHPGLGAHGDLLVATHDAGTWQRVDLGRAGTSATSVEPRVGTLLDRSSAGERGAEQLELDDGPALAGWSPVAGLGWSLVATQPRDEALAAVSSLRGVLALALATAAALAAGIALGVSRRLAVPIGSAVLATRRIAQGDLTEPPSLLGRGETRDLLLALRETNADLASLIGRIRHASGEIVRSSGSVLGVAKDQGQALREFSRTVGDIAAATSHITTGSRELATTMVGLARAADFAATTATSGRTALVDLGKQMGRLNEGGRSVADRLEAIRDRAARIDSMVAAITKVANQTNLLAVNAAIEAEKAGAAGHGFQVVAREIDRLATQTAARVLEIEETVVAVQQAVTEGVVEMSHFIDLVDDGCGTANGVASQMGLIIRQTEELRTEFEQVAQSVETQSQGVAQVNDAMSEVAEGARRTAQAVERSAALSAQLDGVARDLDADVRRFRLPS